MTLWRIFHHPSTFTPDQRAVLASDITKLYTDVGLPAFYVNVFFVPLQAEELFIGGEPRANFVRIVIEQIARQMPSPDTEAGKAHREWWMENMDKCLKPHIADSPELEWEHHIYETPLDLWRVQGLKAPPPESEAEAPWTRENRATPWKL